jgi:hypothetical protein
VAAPLVALLGGPVDRGAAARAAQVGVWVVLGAPMAHGAVARVPARDRPSGDLGVAAIQYRAVAVEVALLVVFGLLVLPALVPRELVQRYGADRGLRGQVTPRANPYRPG